MMSRAALYQAGALALVAAALGGCAINPVSGTPDFVMMTESQEIQLGRSNDPKVRKQYGVYDDPQLQGYVQDVGERVAKHSHRPDLTYHFTVIDTPDVNAFALPGGYIYITRGILAYLNSEAELAAVLGHEVGHVTARHSVRQYSAATAGQVAASILLGNVGQNLFNVLGNALLSGYGRDHELEADRLGAEYLVRNNYDSDAMIRVIGVLKNQEEFEKERAAAENREPSNYHGVFASHPSADQRLQEVVAQAKSVKTSTTATRVGRDEYLKRIDGLTYGDSPKDGIRRKSAFYHRDMNFAVQFPDGWRLQNSPSALNAQSKERDGVITLTSDDLKQQVTPEEYLKTRLKIDVQNGAVLSGTSLSGYAGIAQMNTPYGRSRARVAVVYHDNRAFVFRAAAKTEDAFARYDEQFLATARSLHPLKPEEKPIAEGLKLRTAQAGPRDTFAGLAAHSPLTNYAESVIRLINNKYPTGEPQAGDTLKTIQ